MCYLKVLLDKGCSKNFICVWEFAMSICKEPIPVNKGRIAIQHWDCFPISRNKENWRCSSDFCQNK